MRKGIIGMIKQIITKIQSWICRRHPQLFCVSLNGRTQVVLLGKGMLIKRKYIDVIKEVCFEVKEEGHIDIYPVYSVSVATTHSPNHNTHKGPDDQLKVIVHFNEWAKKTEYDPLNPNHHQ